MTMFLTLISALLLQAATPVTTGKAYKFEKITDGVYYATATGSMVTGTRLATSSAPRSRSNRSSWSGQR